MSPHCVTASQSFQNIGAQRPSSAGGGAAYSVIALFLSESALHNESCIILHDCSVRNRNCSVSIDIEGNKSVSAAIVVKRRSADGSAARRQRRRRPASGGDAVKLASS